MILILEMDSLDYNLAYYALTQERVNQLVTDQQRFIFIEFNYHQNEMLKNIYFEKDQQGFIFKIEFTNLLNGNILICKKEFYPETLYDYVTLDLNDEFYTFYLENINNPKYLGIDLRAIWYFISKDRNIEKEFNIKKVRDSKYIFSYKKLCEYYSYPERNHSDIKVCCKNVGILKASNNKYFCPDHFNKK